MSAKDYDDLSASERRAIKSWVSRLRRLVKDCPDGVVALVNHGSISICLNEDLRDYENTNGHRDNAPYLDAVYETSIFEPNSESL